MSQDRKPDMTPQQELLSDPKGGLKLYKKWAVGDAGPLLWFWYEFLTLTISGLPGILGYGSRAILYPTLFAKCGKRPAIGRGVVIRRPKDIKLGRGVLIDDYCCLDVRGDSAGIEIADRVSIGRYSTIAAKSGRINLAAGVNVGSYCRIATNSKIQIEESVLIGAYSYIGPGNHSTQDGEPLISSQMEIKGGVTIGHHSWIGAGVTILDGVKIGSNAIIGANSLVKDDIPDGGVAVGSPAKLIRINQKSEPKLNAVS